MRPCRTAFLFICFGIVVCLAGCSGGQGPLTPPTLTKPISVVFAGFPPTTLYVGSATQFSAAVENSTSSVGVTWSVTCGTANACGSFSPGTTINGASTVYTAPATVPSGGTVIITATSVADPTKSDSTMITIAIAPTAPITVTFYGTPPPASTKPGASIPVSAQVTNDPNPEPLVEWTASCSLSNCGTFYPLSTTASEISTSYIAPANPASSTIVTIRAASVTDPSKSVSATTTIQLPISVAFYLLPPSSMPTGTSAPISARITNDVSANPQVTWSVTCGNSACGSFSTTTTGDEVSTTYTAPSAVPAGGSATVTATSVADPAKSVSANIPIVARVPNPSLPDGNYVYQMNGQDGSAIAGVFVAAGGYIVGGEQDSTSSEDPSSLLYGYTLDRISGGSYTTEADGTLQITLQMPYVSDESFEVTPAPHGRGFITGEYSYGTHFSGTLHLQTSMAPPAEGYAVALQGDNGYGPALFGGVLNIDTPDGLYTPGAISGTGSELDFRASGSSTDQLLTILPGSVSSPDQYGRVMIELISYIPNETAGVSAYLAGYPIDATHIQLIETSNYYMINNGNYPYSDALGSAISGVAIAQGAATGKFSASSLAGSSYVFAGSGFVFAPVNLPNYSSLTAGVFTAQSDSSIGGTVSWNNGNGQSTPSPQPFTGTYSVDPAGRVTITNLSGANFGDDLYFYLTGNGQGFLLSNDSASVFQGEAMLQQTTPFTAASFNGTYGLNTGAFPFLADGDDVIGSITATTSNGTGSLTGFGVTGKMTGTQVGTTDFPISGGFTPASNRIFQGTITGLNLLSPATPGNFTLYLVDGSQGFAIETDNGPSNLVQLQVP